MSLDSTANLKQQLINHLGDTAPVYFESLQSFVTGKISRVEFEAKAFQVLEKDNVLVQIHNALIISLFDATAAYKRNAAASAAATQPHDATLSPPPAASSKPPPRKRRRTLLPYQGPGVPEDARTMRSMRLKRWILAMGKKERERVKKLPTLAASSSSTQPPPAPMVVDGQPQPPPPIVAQPQQPSEPSRPPLDEIASERGVMLLQERGGPPGGRPPIQLHSSTHAPTTQHIADRINLICAQHNLSLPSRAVAALMSLACEAKLKQLITHALTLTLSSQAISSITPSPASNNAMNPFISSASSQDREAVASALGNQSSASLASSSTLHHVPQKTPVLTTGAFQTLFTLYPASLPNQSAAAMKLSAIPSSVDDDTDDVPVLKDREARDQRWQIMALLAERSAVRECLKSVR
ncbi:hypothetical protein D9611_006202 [Ephemerocybe angulata]|uniref:Uncharacterized protein n=2 Tax=Ephemerocybe angulata TaxID=980116 RepID=A0A8H5C6K6_9AGAR|nr:hypothetical protein D9611_006202 [Tulosesus angulatus]KAF6752994.1 transcriptional regulator of RNA polII, SAGA, subunit-domain-containing protein [Tulosesus angulatus]